MTEPEPIDPSQLRPGPIRHGSLPTDLLEQIRAVYDVLGPFLDTTLEQFEIGFMRDATPEQEVAIWSMITAAWIVYHEQYLDGEEQPEAVEKKLIAALISISTGVEDVESLGVPVDIGRKLLACYDGPFEERSTGSPIVAICKTCRFPFWEPSRRSPRLLSQCGHY